MFLKVDRRCDLNCLGWSPIISHPKKILLFKTYSEADKLKTYFYAIKKFIGSHKHVNYFFIHILHTDFFCFTCKTFLLCFVNMLSSFYLQIRHTGVYFVRNSTDLTLPTG